MMDLKMEVYSPFLELLGLLEIQNSVMWDNKAFSSGSFTLNSLITEESKTLLVPENIIWIAGDDAGIIEYVQQEVGETGPFITVKGYNLTGLLLRRILWGRYDLSGPVPEIMYRLVDDCCINPTRGNPSESRVIPGLVLAGTAPANGLSVRVQKTGGYLLDALEELGTAYGVPFGVRFNPAVPCMEFWARYSVNRSIHQNTVEPVFYSTELDDVLSSEYSYNAQNYRNVALVAGEGEGNDRVMVIVNGDVEPAPEPPTPPTPTKYTITLSVDPEGGGTASGGGTFTEGQSVTVTATPSSGYKFVAWKESGVSRLPNGYTELEYIETTTGFTYIDTGKSLSSKARYVVDSEVTAKGGTSYPKFVIWAEDTAAGLLYQAGNGVQFVIRNNGAALTNINPVSDTSVPRRLKADINLSNGTFSLNGTAYNITVPSDFVSEPSVFLMGGAHANYSLYGKLYSFESYEDGTLVQQMVPCADPSGDVGLYDIVERKFYGNAGTGVFAAGPAASDDAVVSENAEYTFTVSGDRALTAVFEVNKPSRLPEGYTEVEYISNPNLTYIFINSLLSYLVEKSWEIEFEIPDMLPSSDFCIIGSTNFVSDTNYKQNLLVGRLKTSTLTFQNYANSSGNTLKWDIPKGKSTFSFHRASATATLNGVSKTPVISGGPSKTTLFASGGRTSVSYICDYNLFSFKLLDDAGTTVTAEYVPAVRESDGTVGLFLVGSTSSFLVSANSSKNFMAGPAV